MSRCGPYVVSNVVCEWILSPFSVQVKVNEVNYLDIG